MVNLDKKRGISLIVLVITIIVMIILAAAIILSLNSSGIIGKANKAKVDSDSATLREAANAEYSDMLLEYDGALPEDATQKLQERLISKGLEGNKVTINDKGEVQINITFYVKLNNVEEVKSWGSNSNLNVPDNGIFTFTCPEGTTWKEVRFGTELHSKEEYNIGFFGALQLYNFIEEGYIGDIVDYELTDTTCPISGFALSKCPGNHIGDTEDGSCPTGFYYVRDDLLIEDGKMYTCEVN